MSQDLALPGLDRKARWSAAAAEFRAPTRYPADVVLGTTQAPTGSYVDRGRVDRSSDESYDPRHEGELWKAAERLTAFDS
ncbi:hypothetical protein [Streptomyces sp. NPDC048436]|uniref:hypothetical protein n=1 Tax=Streptomyces sp. NPDC048436 TaxID=3365550 RepID=UPI00371D8E46